MHEANECIQNHLFSPSPMFILSKYQIVQLNHSLKKASHHFRQTFSVDNDHRGTKLLNETVDSTEFNENNISQVIAPHSPRY